MKRIIGMMGTVLLLVALTAPAYADPTQGPGPGPQGPDPTKVPEEDDYKQTPYTGFGDFNGEDEEAAATKYFQYGRFFALSLGLGFESVSGNRGALWQGGFPLVELKAHYWFNFNFALDLDFYNVGHFYPSASGPNTTVKMSYLGANVRYYFDTKNLPAGVTFASPFISIGGGSYSKTETSGSTAAGTPDSAFGFAAGGGFEFVASPHSVYVVLEGKVHFVTFTDTQNQTSTSSGATLPDLTGEFYTGTLSVMFTW
ncbi:hypothetical protein K2X30_15915 [bacterium]|nr:hypothetical protein [bacterium]